MYRLHKNAKKHEYILNEDKSCVRLLIKGNLERNHNWESDDWDSN